jgi:hypothetical protein
MVVSRARRESAEATFVDAEIRGIDVKVVDVRDAIAMQEALVIEGEPPEFQQRRFAQQGQRTLTREIVCGIR